jgi:predicted MFS family arabinose efflux permease
MPGFRFPTRPWRLVLGLAFTQCIGFGVTINAFGLLTLPTMAHFHCSQGEAGAVAAIFLAAMTLVIPCIGWLLDHVTPRPVITIGTLLAGLAYLVAARSGTLGLYMAAMGIAGVGIAASTYVPAVMLIAHWIPPTRQGLAYGIMLGGISLGGIVFPPLLTRLLAVLSWREVFDIQAALLLVVCMPLLWKLAVMPPRSPEDHRVSPGVTIPTRLGVHLRSWNYWLWVVVLALLTLSGVSLLMLMIPFLQSIGLSAENAAWVYAAAGTATFLGSLLFGTLSTRWGPHRTLFRGTLLSVTGVGALMVATHPALRPVALVLFCIAWGSTFNLANQVSPTLLQDLVDEHHFGMLFGIGNLFSGIAAAAGPVLLGGLVDTTRTYTPSLGLCAVLFLATLPMIYRIRPGPAAPGRFRESL